MLFFSSLTCVGPPSFDAFAEEPPSVFAYGSAVSGRVITSRERVESAESYLDQVRGRPRRWPDAPSDRVAQMCTAAPDMIANVACKADCSAILEEIGLNLSLSRWEIGTPRRSKVAVGVADGKDSSRSDRHPPLPDL